VCLPDIRAQSYDERFIRTWDFYLCYCETAFAEANTGVIQFTLEHA
jgi:cyclopropane-fatty-acyl-phospholipid synthase